MATEAAPQNGPHNKNNRASEVCSATGEKPGVEFYAKRRIAEGTVIELVEIKTFLTQLLMFLAFFFQSIVSIFVRNLTNMGRK